MTNKQLNYFLRFLVIGLILLLNACSTVTKDGPPNYDVDVSKIPNATPKQERLSRYGNRAYKVFGRNYHVMHSSKNYRQVGVASWYGSKFHAQRTSSGERYDMLGMTAAHKSLPLPTYVEVTNLANGRKVIVKVNDRGPFESNRLIDLSYVAAKKLGMLGHGTAKVEVKAIDPVRYAATHNTTFSAPAPIAAPETTPAPAATNLATNFDLGENSVKLPEPPKPVGKTYIQVGVFKNKLYAERLKKRLHKLTSSPVNVIHSQHLYKVQIGPVHDYAMARHLSKKLHAEGLHSKEFTEV